MGYQKIKAGQASARRIARQKAVYTRGLSQMVPACEAMAGTAGAFCIPSASAAVSESRSREAGCWRTGILGSDSDADAGVLSAGGGWSASQPPVSGSLPSPRPRRPSHSTEVPRKGESLDKRR